MKVFGSYSHYYDLLYQDKDYKGECDLLEKLFEKYSENTIHSLLDLGCGTGNHAVIMANRGYKVVGLDASKKMLELAQQKLDRACKRYALSFFQKDVRSFILPQKFDAAIMMFAVLGYQLTNRDVLSTLRSVRKHLRPRGLFIFDVWHGPAVLFQKPTPRIKILPAPSGKIIRFAIPKLNTAKHQCIVRYLIWRIKRNQILEEVKENHSIRFFFPLELETFLKSTDFTLLHLGAFPQIEQRPSKKTWNVLGVARAI